MIIGASAAGLAAAETLRRVDPDGQVTVLCREKTQPYSRVLLPYLLAGVVREEDVFLPLPEGVELLTGKEVVRVDPQRREVIVSTGEVFPFDRLLIASGASAVRPKIKGADLPFVFTVRDLSDIQRMREWVRKGGRAVISGGGPVSMKVGEALHRLGMKVTFVISSNRVLSRILDLPASEIVERVLRENGLEVVTSDDIVEIKEGEVRLRSGASRKCDLVVFGKGVRPNVGFLADSGIEVQRGIVVDECLRTNLPNIYAAGDVAEALDIIHKKRMINALWPVAREQGHIAALNMASLPTVYEGSVARNTVEIFGLSIFTAGVGWAEGPEVLREQGRGFYRKLVLDKGVLKGVIFVGKVKDEGLYLSLMQRKLDVSPFVRPLLKNAFCYPHLARWRWGGSLVSCEPLSGG